MRYIRHFRWAVWRTIQHGGFSVAKAAAYSAILMLFPAFIVIAWMLSKTNTAQTFLNEISYAVGVVLPPGSRTAAVQYFTKHSQPKREIWSAFSVMIFAASGVMISWMDGFRRAYNMKGEKWGFIRERLMALFLVVLSFAPMAFAMGLIAFGNLIERYIEFKLLHRDKVVGAYLILLWTSGRWLIAGVTSVTVIMLIYHWALPRVQPWHKVIPGAMLATMLWFPVTILFGWYVTNYATYNLVYGPLGAAIALLVWLYIISIIILIGAEFNAQVAPRIPRKERRFSDRRLEQRRSAAPK